MSLLLPYWRPLLGTAGCWALFDIVEYGLKQNDAAIFDSGSETAYSRCLGESPIRLTRGYCGSSDHPMLILDSILIFQVSQTKM